MEYIFFIIILVILYMIYKNINLKGLNFKSVPFKFNNKEIDQKLTIDQKFNAIKVRKKKRMDYILDKISNSGLDSLTKNEKDFLDNY